MAATQTATLRLFTALSLLQKGWAGKLLLGVGLNDSGRALALASLAAGAASLFLESDDIRLREAVREGCCTFAVTTLEEALRILKNEIRQGHAVAVALGGEGAPWLREMVERGVVPFAVASSRALRAEEEMAVASLGGWGAVMLSGCGLPPIADVSRNLDLALAAAWTVAEDRAASSAERRLKDTALRAEVPVGLSPAIVSGWFDSAPSLFPRDRNRSYWRLKPSQQNAAALM